MKKPYMNPDMIIENFGDDIKCDDWGFNSMEHNSIIYDEDEE